MSPSRACSKTSKCEEIFDHTVSLLPAEMKDKIAGSKADAITSAVARAKGFGRSSRHMPLGNSLSL